MTESMERQNKMNRLIFNKENIEEIRGVVNGMLDMFAIIISRPFEHGNLFTYKDVLDRMMKVDTKEWWNIECKYIKDPFHDYIRGDFSASEKGDPAKILLDVISLLAAAEKSVYHKLQEYESVFRSLKDDKRSKEEQLHEAQTKLIDEVQTHSLVNIELKSARAKLDYFDNALQEKNNKIAELQRYNTIELWEREKKKVLMESNAKLVETTEELEETKRINKSHAKKIQILEEQNRMMKMKHELNSKPSSLATSQALEDLKRQHFLLEKDVMFLEEELNGLQKVYIAVLGGIRTDLHIASEKYRSPETNELTDVDLEQLDNRLTFVYEKAKNAELEKNKSDLLPHYQYIPADVKVKRIKRISMVQKDKSETDGSKDLTSGAPRRRHFMAGVKAASAAVTVKKTLPPVVKKEPVENPDLLLPSRNAINWDVCKKHFPDMTKEMAEHQFEQFKEYDDNGDRSLDFSEVISALSGMGMQFTAAQAEEAMREVDVNKSNSLDFYEYILVTEKIAKQSGKAQLFKSNTVRRHSNVVAKTCVVQ